MIAFIGAGKVGTALGMYFQSKGFEINGYYSRTSTHAENAALLTKSAVYTNLEKLIYENRFIWITTNDDNISQIADEISTYNGRLHEKIFLHASGVHTSLLLHSLGKRGYGICSAHPLLAFSEPFSAAEKLQNTYFTLEGNEKGVEVMTDFFKRTGNLVLKIDAEKKILYHTAACVLSNYLVTLVDCSYRLFEKSGFSENEIKKATMPLLESVVENLQKKENKDALTGPIKRGDKETVRLHLQALEKEMPELSELYKELGRQTMRMLSDNRLNDILV